MDINHSLIKKLEKLARLDLTDSEREIIRKDLENILDMVNKIQEFDTENIEPLRYINEDFNQLRNDQEKDSLNKEQTFRNADKSEGRFFKVPKVIDVK